MNEHVITDGITSLVANLGTERDKSTSVYYTQPVQDEEQLRAAYRTSWLANKIVDIPAFDSFRRWRSWQASDAHVELLEAEEKRLDIKAKLLKTETLARLYGGAALYFDLGDESAKPAPAKIAKGGIRFVTVMTHRHLAPGDIDLDPLSPTFGLPLWYAIVGATAGEVRIHPSRLVLRYGGNRLDAGLWGISDGIWGDSVLYPLLQAVQQFDATTANIASLVFESKVDVISVKGLMSMVGDPMQESRLLDRYRLAATAKGNNGMLLLDGDTEEYTQKSASFASLPDIMDRFAQNAAGGADIPMTRLFGKSPGGMNSTGESDLRNYYDRISANQALSITPSMQVLDELLIQSAIGSRPKEVHYIWSSLWQIGETERAEIGNKNANTVKAMLETGLIADEALAEGLIGMMVEASVMPGLETAVAKYGPPPEEDPVDAVEPGAKPVDKKPQLKVVGDEQSRVPAGSGGNASATPDRVDLVLSTAKVVADPIEDAYNPNQSREANSRWGSGGGAGGGFFANFKSDRGSPELRAMLDEGTVTKESLLSDPSFTAAVAAVEAETPTDTHPDYGTDAYFANRVYLDGDGKELMGDDAAADYLYKSAGTLAYGGDPSAPPVRQERLATIITGAQAAGKSTAADPHARAIGARIIDADKAKKVIPEFKGGVGVSAVHEESGTLMHNVFERAMRNGDNMVIPTVGGSSRKLKHKIETLKKNGYTVTVALIDTSPDQAWRRMAGRWISTGRLIPPIVMNSGVNDPGPAFEQLLASGAADNYIHIGNDPGPGLPRNKILGSLIGVT